MGILKITYFTSFQQIFVSAFQGSLTTLSYDDHLHPSRSQYPAGKVQHYVSHPINQLSQQEKRCIAPVEVILDFLIGLPSSHQLRTMTHLHWGQDLVASFVDTSIIDQGIVFIRVADYEILGNMWWLRFGVPSLSLWLNHIVGVFTVLSAKPMKQTKVNMFSDLASSCRKRQTSAFPLVLMSLICPRIREGQRFSHTERLAEPVLKVSFLI